MIQLIQALASLFKDPAAIRIAIAIAVTVLLYFLFNAAVGAMEMPDKDSTRRYRFWFRFLNRLAGNLDRAAKALHVPGVDGEPPAADSAAAGK